VFDGSGQHVRDGLDAAVRVPWKAGEIVGWYVVTEIVKQQEGIVLRGVAETKCAAQMHARAFPSRLRLDEPFYWADRHGIMPLD
jgi:hypothetical protein